MLLSKLPKVGTTIFTVMSALAQEYDAINLGQGFPDFPCDRRLTEALYQASLAGHNQYPPMAGILPLRLAISEKLTQLYGHTYDPDSEITVTAGGTQGIFTVVAACVRPGDEVIVIEPVYDSYIPAIEAMGGQAVRVAMELRVGQDGKSQSYELPWAALKAAISPKTRMIMINSPHNPTGMVWSSTDLERLARLVRDTSILICSDEVYEHMVYDGQRHCSIASHPELAQRSFLISSFGKTYHVTGWKIGFVAAPRELSLEFRKVHQFNVFTVHTPTQYAIHAYMQDPSPYLELANFYQAKRDLFRQGLASTGLQLLPAPGTYFQCVNYRGLQMDQAAMTELDFCRWLTQSVGVAAIPVSAFYEDKTESGIVRFCYAKQDITLQKALERLQVLQ
jgi:methionine aminotransferase